MQKKWFVSKSFGYGWTPATKEGWIVTLAAIVLIIFFSLDAEKDLKGMLIKVSLTVIVLIAICIKTGEKPKWNWSLKKKK